MIYKQQMYEYTCSSTHTGVVYICSVFVVCYYNEYVEACTCMCTHAYIHIYVCVYRIMFRRSVICIYIYMCAGEEVLHDDGGGAGQAAPPLGRVGS